MINFQYSLLSLCLSDNYVRDSSRIVDRSIKYFLSDRFQCERSIVVKEENIYSS